MKLAGAYINDETYGRLAALAAANNRTLAGQCRHLFDRALKGDLEVPDGPVARAARAAAAHAVPGTGAVPKRVAKQGAVPGAETLGKPPYGMPLPELPVSAMPPADTPPGTAVPKPQAVSQCGGAHGAAIFEPDTTPMHTPTMNTQPSGGASQRTPRRNPR